MNEKQRRFADYYIESCNAEESAIKAGYSKRTARGHAHKMLRNVAIKEYITKRMEELQDERVLSQTEILVILSDIARGEAKEHKEVVTRKAEYIDNPNSDKQTLVYNEYTDVIGLPTKNSDRNRAAELLGKRYAMWTDNKNVDVKGAVTFIDDIGEDDET